MESYDKICKLVEAELDKIAAKPEMNDAVLTNLYKLIDVKKDLLEIEEMEQQMQQGMMYGQSGRYPMPPMYPDMMRASYGNSYGNSYGQNGGNSGEYYGNSRENYGGGGSNRGQSGHYPEQYGYRGMNPQLQDDVIRQTMNKLYN